MKNLVYYRLKTWNEKRNDLKQKRNEKLSILQT